MINPKSTHKLRILRVDSSWRLRISHGFFGNEAVVVKADSGASMRNNCVVEDPGRFVKSAEDKPRGVASNLRIGERCHHPVACFHPFSTGIGIANDVLSTPDSSKVLIDRVSCTLGRLMGKQDTCCGLSSLYFASSRPTALATAPRCCQWMSGDER